jgi:microcystin-dependent protein
MAEPFLGEIRMFAGNFAPENWAFCDGQELPKENNSDLFSLLKFNYGGNGTTIFALPDLRGRIPLNSGSPGNLSVTTGGMMRGEEQIPLSINQIPRHNHEFNCTEIPATSMALSGDLYATTPDSDLFYASSSSSNQVKLIKEVIGTAGGDMKHDNRMPTLCLNFIIALKGLYPERS